MIRYHTDDAELLQILLHVVYSLSSNTGYNGGPLQPCIEVLRCRIGDAGLLRYPIAALGLFQIIIHTLERWSVGGRGLQALQKLPRMHCEDNDGLLYAEPEKHAEAVYSPRFGAMSCGL